MARQWNEASWRDKAKKRKSWPHWFRRRVVSAKRVEYLIDNNSHHAAPGWFLATPLNRREALESRIVITDHAPWLSPQAIGHRRVMNAPTYRGFFIH